jgi:serine protease Do
MITNKTWGLRAAIAAALVAGAATGYGTAASGVVAQVQAAANDEVRVLAPHSMPASFADLAATVRPAVVFISTTSVRPTSGESMGPPGGAFTWPHLRERFAQRPVAGVGSGFIVDPSGVIVTNFHVIDGAQTINVTLEDGSEHEATLVGADEKTDLAVLRIDAGRDLSSVNFGDSDATRVGDWVVAIGNPFGLGGSVSAGIVSARGRDIHAGPYDDYLQFDASINRGNSGGPLFNTLGQVVGVNTAIFSPSGGNVGIGFAVPASTAQSVVEQLADNGKVDRGWAGIRIQPLTPGIAKSLGLDKPKGALVAGISPDSPAATGGLLRGDVIQTIQGRAVDDVRQAVRTIGSFRAGTEVVVRVWRDGKLKELTLSLAAAPDTPDAVAQERSPVESKGQLGVQLADLDAQARQAWKVPRSTTGALVVAVAPDSPASRGNLRPGDIIVTVDRAQVRDARAAAAAISGRKAKDQPVLLLLERGGMARYVALEMG